MASGWPRSLAKSGIVCDELGLYGFTCDAAPASTTETVLSLLDGRVGVLYYVGHGVSDEVLSVLPLGHGEMLTPGSLDRLDGMTMPFVVLCACVAGRVRHGAGGYQSGLAARLLERGAPGVVAFLQPIPERRAYELAATFRRAAYDVPFGLAVRGGQRSCASQPSYAWLSMAAYGDPMVSVKAMSSPDTDVPSMHLNGTTWDSALRRHCVWRTPESADGLRERLSECHPAVAAVVTDWLDVAFAGDAAPWSATLDTMRAVAIETPDLHDVERLSLLAGADAELMHRAGYDSLPLQGISTRERLFELHRAAWFVSVVGGALFDMPLNASGTCSSEESSPPLREPWTVGGPR